ncbi:hypothetical protein JCM4814A_80510 [Streptomyces phaeofaciens JCM 4814]|uniref:Uncharacterized protein n=1 Tax=Streptomyces phaeofaciens TaxID=68254 RepID=A0A918M133_9ACTN|nr:hypothetical protein GCM10010226_81660 [Streptomyces phaeofaciens]
MDSEKPLAFPATQRLDRPGPGPPLQLGAALCEFDAREVQAGVRGQPGTHECSAPGQARRAQVIADLQLLTNTVRPRTEQTERETLVTSPVSADPAP